MLKKIEQIVVRTKRIGKYSLNKVVSLAYTRYDTDMGGWWVSIVNVETKSFVEGWGETKREAKRDFEKEFGKNLRIFKDLLKCPKK